MPQPPEKPSLTSKCAWSLGAFSDVFVTNALSYLAFPIYNIGLHVDPRFLGWALGIPRIWEAITDPLIGRWSDNTRSRWGRRKPFVLIGALLCGIFFALLWWPPTQAGPGVAGWYLCALAFLLYTAYAIFFIPWGAAGLELSSDYNERTQIQAIRAFVQNFGGLFLGMLWWLSFQWGGGNALSGVRWVGVLFGALIAIAGITAALGIQERKTTQAQPKMSLAAAVSGPFRNSQFLVVCGITLLVLLGIFLIQPLTLYINIYHVFGGNKESVASLNMIMNFAFQGAGLLWTPLVALASQRFGKKTTLQAGLALVVLANLSTWFTYTPAMPYLQAVSLALSSVGLSCLWIITPSMIADICDMDKRESGLRREGTYNATFAWTTKAGISLTLVLSGYLVDWSGFRAELDAQPAEVVERLRLMFMLIPAGLVGAALFLTRAYRLDQATLERLQKQPSPEDAP